jgi:hypothetical protein
MPSSNRNWIFWVATGLAGLTLVLVIANTTFAIFDQSLRTEVTQRQQFIEQSVQLARLEQELINALGAAALRNDTAIRDMLAANGITVTANPAPATGSAATPGQPAPHR